MKFQWKNYEANFGVPEEKEIDGGTHFTVEIITKYNEKYIAARRPQGYPGHQLPPKAAEYPQGCLYFCHGLPLWGETTEQAIKRIVLSLINVEITSYMK